LKGLAVEPAQEFYEHPANQLIAGIQIKQMEQLTESIEKLERAVLKVARELPYYPKLKTLPGVGIILGLTMTMEVGDIKRFANPGHFAGYCRTVDFQCLSNGKQKGQNNRKCGNKYLAWAFVEAANFAKRYDEACRKGYDRKAAKTSTVIATKALACKLAKAAWYLMAQAVDYQARRVFPQVAARKARA
jgi:transposase